MIKKVIYFDGQQVSQFRYLGSLISEDGYCTKEIWSRIEMVKKVLMEKKKLFTSKMSLKLKEENNEMLGLHCCTMWCGAEMWTLTQTDRRLEPFEM